MRVFFFSCQLSELAKTFAINTGTLKLSPIVNNFLKFSLVWTAMELLVFLSVMLNCFEAMHSHHKVEDVSIKGVRKEIKTLQNYKHTLLRPNDIFLKRE